MKTININNSMKNSLTVSLISSVLFLASCKKDEFQNLQPKAKGSETARLYEPIKDNWEPPIAADMQSANQARQALPVKHDLILHIPVSKGARADAASQREGGHMQDASGASDVYPVSSLLPSSNNARQIQPIYNDNDPGFPYSNVAPNAKYANALPTAASARLASGIHMGVANTARVASGTHMAVANPAKAIFHNEIQPAQPVIINSTK